MALTDRRGRSLKAFLIAEIVGDEVTMAEVREALGIKQARWYGDARTPGRSEADDFPDPTELYRLARFYDLTDEQYIDLLVDFGWVSTDIAPGFTGRSSPMVGNRVRTDRPTL